MYIFIFFTFSVYILDKNDNMTTKKLIDRDRDKHILLLLIVFYSYLLCLIQIMCNVFHFHEEKLYELS